MSQQLKNKVVCVTGGARGIGKATAKLLASYGAEVWIGDIDLTEAQHAVKEIGATTHAQQLDVTDPISFQNFLNAPQKPIDMLVNNAGVMHTGAFHEISLDAHLREISIDLSGVTIGMRLVLPSMLERNEGHIVNVASMAGKLTLSGVATYNATKFGVVALSRAVRNEIHHSKVSISTVLPSAVQTDLLSGISTKWVPTLKPEDIAKTIVDSYFNKRPEIAVPRWANTLGIVEQLLPEKVFNALKRSIGGQRLLSDVDQEARSKYSKRSI